MVRNFAIGCGVLLVVLFIAIGGGIWAVFQITAPAANSATHFVNTAHAAGPAAAYAEAAPSLRAAIPEPAFEAQLKQLRLDQATSVSWSNRNINGDVATLSGTAKTASGDTTPITIQLVKSGDRWLVSNMSYGVPAPTD